MAILADLKTSEPITNREYEVLSALLTLLRDDETQWIPDFLGSLKRYVAAGDQLTPESVIGDVIQAYYNEPTAKSLSGVLVSIGFGAQFGGYEEIAISEFQELSNYLKVLRAGGWLEERISLECSMFAEGRRYTPGEVIQHIIGGDLDQFQMDVDSTKELVRDYPHLFENDLLALNVAQAKPEPEEQPEPATAPKKSRKRATAKAA